ncbi:MAG: MerR family DNA-binding transcriptional regulator [Elusimicrobia bacterium]|jgi:DNA-binding transcriptional MerR regulator|nr:MerR family DNA-binding transcriptional regulator [Elusimicrobiota bacterium]
MFKKNEKFVKIGKIADESGLPVSTIRYYLNFGLLSEAYRTPGDVRIFNKAKTLGRIDDITDAATSRTLKEVAAAV